MTAETAEVIALFRYRVIAAAIGPQLSPAERGAIVRALARQVHEHPDGTERQYSRGTLDRWLRAYREQGLDGLKPDPRADLGAVRRHPALLDEACALRSELPTRSAAQIAAILRAPPHPCRRAHHPRASAAARFTAVGPRRSAACLRSLRSRPTERGVDRRRSGRPVRPASACARQPQSIPVRAGRRLLAIARPRSLGGRSLGGQQLLGQIAYRDLPRTPTAQEPRS